MSTPSWTPFTGKTTFKADELDAAFAGFVACINYLDETNIAAAGLIGPTQQSNPRSLSVIGNVYWSGSWSPSGRTSTSSSFPFVLSEESRIVGFRLRASCKDSTKPINVGFRIYVDGSNNENGTTLIQDDYDQEQNVLDGADIVNYDDQTRLLYNERNQLIITPNSLCRMVLIASVNDDATCNVQWVSGELFIAPLHTRG